MNVEFLLIWFAFWAVKPLTVQDQPLTPVWSPDHQVLAATKVDQAFVTPEGADYKLELNSKVVYPPKAKHHRTGYEDQHTFLSEMTWSPDGKRVAFVEKVYNWEYFDPYNRDFYGEATRKTYFVALVGRDGTALGYKVGPQQADKITLEWVDDHRLTLNGQTFDLMAQPPTPIP